MLQCPTCKQPFTAQGNVPIARVAQEDPAFDRDKFLLRQKVVSINQKYAVSDEQNQPILFVERPAHLLQNLMAALAGAVVAILIIAGTIFLAMQIWPDGPTGDDGTIMILMLAGSLLLGTIAAVCVGVPLSALRHVSFYRDLTKSEKLLDILQDKKFQPINATFTVRDRAGEVLCRLRKNILYNLIRKRWYCYAPDGSLAYVAMEDSIVLSLLRRFLGPMFGILRTNYIIQPAGSEDIIGEFNRKFTLFDRYVLDLSADPSRTLDRRVALAIGVMLDTGERR